jgi:hypothetical protein
MSATAAASATQLHVRDEGASGHASEHAPEHAPEHACVSDITIDLSSLQCYVTIDRSEMFYPSPKLKERYRIGSKFREPRLVTTKVQCQGQVVFRIFRDDGSHLDACNQHFNEYFESHEIGADMVMRLSDDEEDFLPVARRGRERKRMNVSASVSASANIEPLCRVPKRRAR